MKRPKIDGQYAVDTLKRWERDHDLFEVLSLAQAASLLVERYGVTTDAARKAFDDNTDWHVRQFTPTFREFPPFDAATPSGFDLPQLWIEGRTNGQGVNPYKLVFQNPGGYSLARQRFVWTRDREEALVAELMRRQKEQEARAKRRDDERQAKWDAEAVADRAAFDAHRPALAGVLRDLEEAVPGIEIRASARPLVQDPGVVVERLTIEADWETMAAFEAWMLNREVPAAES